MMRSTLLYSLLLALASAGCDDEPTEVTPNPDSAPAADSDVPLDSTARVDGGQIEDAVVVEDAAPDAEPDAAPDAEPDAAPDAEPDAAPDVALDAGPAEDAAPDVALDMGPDEDAAPDAAPDAEPDAAPDAEPDVFINPCPDDRLPEPEICDGVDNDCNGVVDDGLGLADACEAPGRCGVGFLECDDEGGVRCSTGPGGSLSLAVAETCNGVDDDCDGEIDEAPQTLAVACYTGPPETLDVGACEGGFRPCEAGGLGECQGQTTPQGEVCDGADNDCDGEIDEGYQPIEICGEGVCRANSTPSTCVDGVETPCVPGDPLGADDNCDGVDDDCDGVADDDFVPDGGCGVGTCADSARPSSCVAGVFTPCFPGQGSFNDATCDGVDDDCDGIIDEDYLPDANCGRGVCRQEATPSSCADGVETPCQPGQPAAEDLCDGRDEDCDGEIDEDYADELCGEGVCASRSSCINGNYRECRPLSPRDDEDTLCDGFDEDCDGEIDEDYQPTAVCGVGECRARATPSSCANGVETPCLPGVPAAEEDLICDGLDEDCDGLVDEDIPQVIEDRCDGVDDDCDALIDEDVVPFQGGERRLTDAEESSSNPRLSVKDGRFYMVWSDARPDQDQSAQGERVYIKSLNNDGSIFIDDTAISVLGGDHSYPDLAWGASDGLLVWQTTRVISQILYRRVQPSGAALGEEALIATPNVARNARVAFNGESYGVIWIQEESGSVHDLYFAQISSAGALTAGPTQINTRLQPEGRVLAASLTATQGGFAVVYADLISSDLDLFFQKLHADGQADGARVPVADGERSSNYPSIATLGDGGFAVAWYDLRDGNNEIYAARLDANGAKIGADRRITNTQLSSTNPSVFSDGAHIGLVWQELVSVGNHEVFFQWLDDDAQPLGDALRLSEADEGSFSPHLTRLDGLFLCAWFDTRDLSNREIYGRMGTFGCPPE